MLVTKCYYSLLVNVHRGVCAAERVSLPRVPPPPPAVMERPSLRATVPPLRQRRWTPEAQRRILQHELIDTAFYRHLSNPAEAADTLLLDLLEREFNQLIARRSSGLADDGETDAVCCIRFPPMHPRHRYLIAACAGRYHLQTSSFDEDEKRFTVAYKHARDTMAPVLTLADIRLASSYYTPPPPPKKVEHGGRQQKTQRREEVLPLLPAPLLSFPAPLLSTPLLPLFLHESRALL